ncbi:hypothetical protein [Paenibacillus sp. WLX2291]|uniref:hypothetical protein n=1 Tax=Paenibacillus sp. WLX2291 TaxID=3296934 RepID=UPI003983E074
MSWDVMILHITGEITDIEEITEDQVIPLGSKHTVIDRLRSLFPDGDFRDSAWGTLEREHYFIEFNIGSEEEIDSIMLHIRGDDDAIEVLRIINEETGWTLIDDGEGIIDFADHPEKGFQKWQQYRDQVMKDMHEDDTKS